MINVFPRADTKADLCEIGDRRPGLLMNIAANNNHNQVDYIKD